MSKIPQDDFFNETLVAKWFVIEDDVIPGYFSISAINKSVSQHTVYDKNYIIAEFLTNKNAAYIVSLHNLVIDTVEKFRAKKLDTEP